jgi:hypothetical protein
VALLNMCMCFQTDLENSYQQQIQLPESSTVHSRRRVRECSVKSPVQTRTLRHILLAKPSWVYIAGELVVDGTGKFIILDDNDRH